MLRAPEEAVEATPEEIASVRSQLTIIEPLLNTLFGDTWSREPSCLKARRMAAELSPDDPSAVTVIATGGLAPLVIDEVPAIDAHEPWLTLIGLRLVWDRNIGPAAAGN